MAETIILIEKTISNEMDAINLLEKILNNEIDTAHLNIKVKNFTPFNLHVSGDKFHQTITSSVMKGFLEMQTAIYKSYSLIRYNDEVPNKLTQDDRDELELEVKVLDGSSGFNVDWDSLFNALIEKTVGRMTGKQVYISVLFLIATFGGHSFYQSYIESQTDIRKAEIELKAKQQESDERLETIKTINEANKRTLDVLEKAVIAEPKNKIIKSDAKEATTQLIKSVRSADNVEFQNAMEFSGGAAREITTSSKSSWEPKRIDGEYIIQYVDSSNAAKRKIRIKSVETGQTIVAVLENDTLDQKILNIIKNAEWGYTKVFLKIKTQTSNGKFKDSIIIGANNTRQV
ncbi:hypothetical protein GWP85_07005 [Acinetobacter beijerinckii]|uniref:hypothetical protein n=1 Tax=Acinetobacter beijerinckii TaxID=262668 RepID=UPI0023DDED10|nr:hypothetical protein [Acinetobacter beijerinckii]MDF2417266.1 hypothetical protein [Acinetobacter beijerinckii]